MVKPRAGPRLSSPRSSELWLDAPPRPKLFSARENVVKLRLDPRIEVLEPLLGMQQLGGGLFKAVLERVRLLGEGAYPPIPIVKNPLAFAFHRIELSFDIAGALPVGAGLALDRGDCGLGLGLNLLVPLKQFVHDMRGARDRLSNSRVSVRRLFQRSERTLFCVVKGAVRRGLLRRKQVIELRQGLQASSHDDFTRYAEQN